MKVLSLFSGVGGFDLGLEAAGMETVGLCEWDKKAASVLRRHWPHVPIYGDVSDLTGTQLLADGVEPDLIAFGSPCQDLSVAGKRAGLTGERSGLFHEAIRIIRELRTLTDGTLPRWVIWENVVGALNSNGGADFQAVLNEMGDLGAHLIEWAVLDAQNFGVAQRRRRVFLVACLDPVTARGCPDPLLPIGEGRPRDLAPLRTAWKNATRPTSPSPRGGDQADIDYVLSPVTLRQREGKPGGGKGPLLSDQSLTLATANDQTIFQSVFQPTIIIDRAAYNQGENARYEPSIEATDLVPTVIARGPHAVATPIGFSHTQGLDAQPSEDAWPTLRREGNGHAVAQSTTTDVIGTLSPGAHPGGLNGQDAYTGQLIPTPYAVRRLLPVECERLMGWPDDWTRWDANGHEQADAHRYKQIGNGVASPVAAWLGRHLRAIDIIARSRA